MPTASSRPDLTVRAGGIVASFAEDPVVGTLHAIGQDARFTSGASNTIALASSTECGTTWRDQVRANAEPTVPALTPTPAALPSGLVGVMYYDFRQTGTSSSNRRPTAPAFSDRARRFKVRKTTAGSHSAWIVAGDPPSSPDCSPPRPVPRLHHASCTAYPLGDLGSSRARHSSVAQSANYAFRAR